MDIRITRPEFIQHSISLDKGQIVVEVLQDGTRRFHIDAGNLAKDKADAYVKTALDRAKKALDELNK